jgi:hypothetical protein
MSNTTVLHQENDFGQKWVVVLVTMGISCVNLGCKLGVWMECLRVVFGMLFGLNNRPIGWAIVWAIVWATVWVMILLYHDVMML